MRTIGLAMAVLAAACGGAEATRATSAGSPSVNLAGEYVLTMSSAIDKTGTAFSGTLFIGQHGTSLDALALVSVAGVQPPTENTIQFSGSIAADGSLLLVSLPNGGINMQGTIRNDGSLSGGCVGLWAGAAWLAVLR